MAEDKNQLPSLLLQPMKEISEKENNRLRRHTWTLIRIIRVVKRRSSYLSWPLHTLSAASLWSDIWWRRDLSSPDISFVVWSFTESPSMPYFSLTAPLEMKMEMGVRQVASRHHRQPAFPTWEQVFPPIRFQLISLWTRLIEGNAESLRLKSNLEKYFAAPVYFREATSPPKFLSWGG